MMGCEKHEQYFGGKLEGKRQFGTRRRRWEGNTYQDGFYINIVTIYIELVFLSIVTNCELL